MIYITHSTRNLFEEFIIYEIIQQQKKTCFTLKILYNLTV